jgi:hypothetical protein
VPCQNYARSQNQRLGGALAWRALRYDHLMFVRLRRLPAGASSVLRCREELLLENLALPQQLLTLYPAGRESGLRLGGRPVIQRLLDPLFSMCSGFNNDRRDRYCGQICNWNFHEDPADLKEDSLYTRKVIHLIPNQISRPIEVS